MDVAVHLPADCYTVSVKANVIDNAPVLVQISLAKGSIDQWSDVEPMLPAQADMIHLGLEFLFFLNDARIIFFGTT